MKLSESIISLIGNTPMVRLESILPEAQLFAKLEFFNPGGSIKDRIALSMIEAAKKDGILTKETVIIEATSGNTGIGLAMVAAAKGYKLVLVMPDTMSIERRRLLDAYGADLVLTPGVHGMKGAIEKAQELAGSYKKSFIPQQFANKANPEIHKLTTAIEIWSDLNGHVDIFVCGVGTGGTITGVGEALKSRKETVKIIAVEPYASPVLSGGNPGPHKIQGISAGFIPDILNLEIVDEIFKVKEQEAYEATRRLALQEGILVGISSGANLHATLEVAKRAENKGKVIVTIFPDSGERYLSTALFQQP